MESNCTPDMRLTNSPFAIPHEDVVELCASQGFQILRSYLSSNVENTFCSYHNSHSTYAAAKQTWLLHRDILHALVMPVVELYTRASALAEAALSTTKTEDLETAFSGDARSAFLWLQCFISEEEQWCRTRGCPACITTAVLSTESHIRLTMASSLLSTASVASPSSSPVTSNSSSPATSPISETPPTPDPTGLTLPPLPQILPALREALAQDPFWGADYFPYFLSRANLLSGGMQALIRECAHLDTLVSSKSNEKPAVQARTIPVISKDNVKVEEKGAKLRKSKLAQRQLRLEGEEVELMRRCALQTWGRAAVPSALRNKILGKSERRNRRLTCP